MDRSLFEIKSLIKLFHLPADLLRVQLVRNLWRVYLKNTENRNKLLVQGIEISNISYQFYDTNPYTSDLLT